MNIFQKIKRKITLAGLSKKEIDIYLNIERKKKKEIILKEKTKLQEIKEERDSKVMLMASEGKTLQEIGNVFGITRERARQILAKYEVKTNEGYRRKNVTLIYCELCGKEFYQSQFSKDKFFKDSNVCVGCAKEQKNKYWGKPYYSKCKVCGTSEIPHRVGGLCNKCYLDKQNENNRRRYSDPVTKAKHKECVKKWHHKTKEQRKEKIKAYSKMYYEKNKIELNRKSSAYAKERYRTDPVFRQKQLNYWRNYKKK